MFDKQLEQLRALIRKRTAVYGAEENTLRVMLEGEQEEERKKDLEKRQRKERERQLQKKREIEAMLFGGNLVAIVESLQSPSLIYKQRYMKSTIL